MNRRNPVSQTWSRELPLVAADSQRSSNRSSSNCRAAKVSQLPFKISVELVFLSLLALGQIARATIFLRHRAKGNYAIIDETNMWALVAIVLAAFYLIFSNSIERFFKQNQGPIRWYMFYLMYCGISVLWSGKLEYGIYRFVELGVNLILMWRIIELLAYRRRAFTYLVWFSGACSLFGILGVFRVFEVSVLFHNNAVPMAGAMGTALCLSAYLTGILSMRAIIVPLVPCLWAFIGGTSAGSNVAFVLSLLVLLFLLPASAKSSRRLLVFVGLLFAAALAGVQSSERLKEIVFPGKSDKQILTATGRTEVWSDYALMIRQKPLFGYGFPIGEKESTVGRIAGSGTSGNAHNMMISVLVNTGLTGFFLFSLWLVSTFRRLFIHIRQQQDAPYATCVFVTLTTAVVNSMTIPVLGTHWYWPIMIILGLVTFAEVYLWNSRAIAVPQRPPLSRAFVLGRGGHFPQVYPKRGIHVDRDMIYGHFQPSILMCLPGVFAHSVIFAFLRNGSL